ERQKFEGIQRQIKIFLFSQLEYLSKTQSTPDLDVMNILLKKRTVYKTELQELGIQIAALEKDGAIGDPQTLHEVLEDEWESFHKILTDIESTAREENLLEHQTERKT